MIPVKCLEYYALDLSNRQHAVYQGVGVNNTGSMIEAQACMWPTEYNIFDGSAAGISYKAKYKLVVNHDLKFEKYYNLYNSQGSLSCVIASDSTGIDHLSNIYYYDSFGEQKEGVSCDMNSRLGYINKEKDYESGLHDHGVRKYDDLSGRFISVDPLWSKYIGWTQYQYSFNDPINFKDGNGLLPGDLFESADQAAHDFGKNYNSMSIEDKREYSSTIYPVEVDGKTMFAYQIPTCQMKDFAFPFLHDNDVAMVHTHANYDPLYKDGNDLFSPNDKYSSEQAKVINYLVSPNGYLQKYDPDTKKTTVISKDMPKDKNDPDAKKNKTPEVKNDEKRSKTYYATPYSLKTIER